MDTLLLELRKLGLKENEAKLYLAGLELGPVPLSALAKKAGITRPTAYEIVRALKSRGLYSETKQDKPRTFYGQGKTGAKRSPQKVRGKKRIFIAESPESLLGTLRLEKRALEEREREFLRTIGTLESKYFSETGGMVKRYRGKLGAGMLREKISFASPAKISVITGKTGRKEAGMRLKIYLDIRRRRGELRVEELCGSSVSRRLPDFVERRAVPALRSFPGTLFIFKEGACFFAGGKEGYLIENRPLLDLLSSLFTALWEKAI